MTTPREDAIAALRAAAEVTVGRFLDTPASLAGVHVAALNDLRDALAALAALAAAPETPDPAAHVWYGDHGVATGGNVPPRAGHWVDLASPETAEALARAYNDHRATEHADFPYSLCVPKCWVAILAAMREAGR